MPDRLVQIAIKGFGWLSAGVLLWLVGTIVLQALPALPAHGWELWQSTVWLPDRQEFGGLAFLFGSLVSSSFALVLAVPMGMAVGMLTCRHLPLIPRGLGILLQLTMGLMSTIPSVIIGLWGITVLIPLFGASMLSAIIVLVMMITPLIAEIYRSAYDDFPVLLRHNSLALGLDDWQTLWQLYLPTHLSIAVSGGVLALGRALGETMAVTMVIGNPTRPSINWSLLAPSATIPSLLANQFGEALETIHISALMYLALILFAITCLANFGALLMRRRLTLI